MRKLLAAIGMVMLVTMLAAASDQSDAMVQVHKFVDGFNRNDVKMALSACADQVSIIDEFAPYHWSGAGACSTWAQAYDADAKKNGITDGVVTLGKPRHVDIIGDHAYVVMPVSYSWKQHGKPMRETASTLTVALDKTASGWRITAWTWSKQ